MASRSGTARGEGPQRGLQKWQVSLSIFFFWGMKCVVGGMGKQERGRDEG
jgi:hypothetical protein